MPGDQGPQGRVPLWTGLRLRRRLHLPGLIEDMEPNPLRAHKGFGSSDREIAGRLLLTYGGKSDSEAVTLAAERLAAILPGSETKEFPQLDHFGIERTAPREVAKAVSNYFLR